VGLTDKLFEWMAKIIVDVLLFAVIIGISAAFCFFLWSMSL
jgi:hypothetical protein